MDLNLIVAAQSLPANQSGFEAFDRTVHRAEKRRSLLHAAWSRSRAEVGAIGATLHVWTRMAALGRSG